MPEPASRRNWLARCLSSSIAATFAVLLYPVGWYLRPKASTTSGALELIAPYRMDELARAQKEGKSLPPFDFGGKPCILFLVPSSSGEMGEPRAIDAVCTHLQCTVEYRPAQQDLFCNCHNGLYDLNGHNISGPPPRPLEVYRAVVGSGEKGKEEVIVSRKA
jgi:cytochrome b6-f complex iron-sulfur subunit